MVDWVARELEEVATGDKRLDNRLLNGVGQAARTGDPTPDRARSNADLKATHRFVANSKVTMDKILTCHNQSTINRCGEHNRVYLVENTIEVDLTKPNH